MRKWIWHPSSSVASFCAGLVCWGFGMLAMDMVTKQLAPWWFHLTGWFILAVVNYLAICLLGWLLKWILVDE